MNLLGRGIMLEDRLTTNCYVGSLGTLLVVTNTDGTLACEAVGPEATELDVGLWDGLVGDQEPCAEDWLGKDVKDGVCDDLLVDRGLASTVRHTPDDWVDGPDEESEATDGGEEAANLAALGEGSLATVVDELEDDDQVCNACNGVPSPLLWCALSSVCSKETSEDHDKVSNDQDQDVSTVQASEEGEIEQEERSGEGPIDVSAVEDLSVDVLVGVLVVAVARWDDDVVVVDSVSSGHAKV